jgi:hypothetical protein
MLLITQPRVGTAHNEILALQMSARSLGWDVLSAPGGWRLDERTADSKVKGVPYGSQTFCEVIAQQMGWTLKQNSFDWLAKVPHQYVKRQIDFMTLGEAEKLTERKFIKPADDKCFDAKVYEPGEFHPNEIIERTYPVLVSDPVQFDIEYRCFVDRNGRVTTWSNYLFYGSINEPQYCHMINEDHIHPTVMVHDLLTHTLASALPTVPSVIDVGLIHGKGMAIIETNQAWASGLYGCDPVSALSVMEQACEVDRG